MNFNSKEYFIVCQENDPYHQPTTYPVLQASLNILTESAVMTNASAQARWPICGFGPKELAMEKLIFQSEKKKTLDITETAYLHHPKCKP